MFRWYFCTFRAMTSDRSLTHSFSFLNSCFMSIKPLCYFPLFNTFIIIRRHSYLLSIMLMSFSSSSVCVLNSYSFSLWSSYQNTKSHSFVCSFLTDWRWWVLLRGSETWPLSKFIPFIQLFLFFMTQSQMMNKYWTQLNWSETLWIRMTNIDSFRSLVDYQQRNHIVYHQHERNIIKQLFTSFSNERTSKRTNVLTIERTNERTKKNQIDFDRSVNSSVYWTDNNIISFFLFWSNFYSNSQKKKKENTK